MPDPERTPKSSVDQHRMRALAHPVRLALLDALRREGELTASRAAELLGDSPGNMSWHLKTLAKYGFVEETGTGKGRSRPWRQVQQRFWFDSYSGDAETQAAGATLEVALEQRSHEGLERWRRARPAESEGWKAAELSSYSTLYLSPEELKQIGEEFERLIERYSDRDPVASREAGLRAVSIDAHGHPLI